MAWASSGGYPGVVSDGAGGLIVGDRGTGQVVSMSGHGGLFAISVLTNGLACNGPIGGASTVRAVSGVAMFGKTPPLAATVGGAATAGGTYTATEEAMLNAVYTALRSIGLLT